MIREMAVAGLEWLSITILIIVILVAGLYIGRQRQKRKITESVVLTLIRSKDGATLDDIILGAHVSSDEASEVLRKLLAKGVIRMEKSNGKIFYKVA